MPGFSESIGTHEVHSINMTLSFFSSSPPYLGISKYNTQDVKEKRVAPPSLQKAYVEPWYICQNNVPLIEKEDEGIDDDSGVPSNLQWDTKYPI